MKANNVTLDEVMTTTADALEAGLLQFSDGSVIGTGGFVEGGNERLNIRHRLPIETADDLAKVPVFRKDGQPPIKLADVANVVETFPPMVGDAVIGVGKPGQGFEPGPGLMMIVEKLPWANTLDVTRGVEEAIESLKPGLPGLEIDTAIFRPASFIETSLKNLSNSLLIGCLLDDLHAVHLPVLVAGGADQRRGHSLVAAGRSHGAQLAGDHRQHDDPGRVRHRLG